MKPNTQFVLGGASATNATQLTAAIDTRGFNFARIICLTNASNVGLHTTAANNKLDESDDLTTFVAIAAAGSGSAYTASSATVTTSLAKLVYEVDLRGRRRYLRPTFSTGATSELLIIAELSQPSDGVVTAAENGAAFLAQI